MVLKTVNCFEIRKNIVTKIVNATFKVRLTE